MSGLRPRSVARGLGGVAAIAAAAGTALAFVAFAPHLHSPSISLPRTIAVTLLAAIVSATAVGVAVGLAVRRLVCGTIAELTAAAKSAAQGKPLARARSPKRDELGDLSRAFDSLCATITDLSVAVIDSDRELEWTRRELKLKEALSLLFELSQSLSAEDNLDTVVRDIPRRVAPALGFDEMAILLYDEVQDAFVVRATYGFPQADEVHGVSFARGEGITGLVASSGVPLVIADTSVDHRYLHYKGRHAVDGSFMCVPMKRKGATVGLFNVLRPQAGGFSEADVRLLTSLANYTALAIAHAEMNERLHDLSVTDELTGVANRRLLRQRAGREVERSRRQQKPLSLLMIDVDHFKRINDELGHLRGDAVLRQVSSVLRDAVRRLDTVARYGGEEFVMLLPDSAKAQALVIAEKLRAAVRKVTVGDRPLTVSIGVATLPEDADCEEALFDAADRALLAAKHAGRDRVVPFAATMAAGERPREPPPANA